MNLTIDIKRNELNVEIKVAGEIDAYTAPELREALFPLAEQDSINMMIDLTEVTYMDSTGLGVIVGVFKMVRAQQGEFEMMGLSNRLERLFDITGLAEIIKINSVGTKGEVL